MKLRKIKRLIAICGISILVFIVILFSNQSSLSAAPLQVTFINVGQGDCALLRDPNGFTMLIDGGKSSAGTTVTNFIKGLGITSIDIVIASHADSDHIGGLITVLQDNSITVHRVLYNGYSGTTATWNNFVIAVNNRGLALEAVQFPQTLQLGLMTIWVMNPASGLDNPETNDASVVIKIIYRSNEFLFTGDIDSTIEATIISRNIPLASDILKVPHHGSAYGSSANFLASVQPKEAVISVGINSYGHPSSETITRLQDAGARVWRTDIYGNVIFNANGVIYTINNFPIYEVLIPFVMK